MQYCFKFNPVSETNSETSSTARVLHLHNLDPSISILIIASSWKKQLHLAPYSDKAWDLSITYKVLCKQCIVCGSYSKQINFHSLSKCSQQLHRTAVTRTNVRVLIWRQKHSMQMLLIYEVSVTVLPSICNKEKMPAAVHMHNSIHNGKLAFHSCTKYDIPAFNNLQHISRSVYK